MAFCNETQVNDLENAECRARRAFKKIESIYKDVMGCCENEENDNYTDYDDIIVTPDIIDVTCNENTLNNFNDIGENFKKYGSRKDITRSSSNLCSRCRNIKETIAAKPHQKQNHELCSGSSWFVFQSCRFPNQELIQHQHFILKNSVNNDMRRKVVRSSCPLKATIPEPFKMTVREMQQKEAKELAKWKLKEQFQKNLKTETQKRIHANPVPAHIHLPLFQKIVNMYEHKKVLRKQKNEERLRAIVKPFNLTKNYGKLERTESAPSLTSTAVTATFKAKPAPKNILSQNWSKDLQIKEKIRKVRIAERSRAMLKLSSLPFTDKKPLRKTSSMVNLMSEKSENIPLFKNSNSKVVKNKSRAQYKEEFEEWNKKVAMVNHLTNNVQDSANSINFGSNMEKCKEFLVSQSLPFYDLPVKMTTTSLLRENQMRTELNEKKCLQEKKKKEKWEQMERDKRVRKAIRPKLKDADPTLDMKIQIEERLKNFRESRQIREQEYQKELQEMKLRLEKRPLLVERQSHIKKDDLAHPLNQLHNGSENDQLISLQDERTSNENSVFSETEDSAT